MMRPGSELPEVFLCKTPVDFRKGIQGLAVVVQDEIALNRKPTQKHKDTI
ncbi:MAG: IS66 family insertion sequence element accessory protein TnpB [Candidatus Sedimenticola endophacoides]